MRLAVRFDPEQRRPRQMNDMRTTIVRLLSNMASTREIQLYLKRFSQLDAARFAVVKVGATVLRDELGALVSSLAFLQQVGLTPIVLHDAGPRGRGQRRQRRPRPPRPAGRGPPPRGRVSLKLRWPRARRGDALSCRR